MVMNGKKVGDGVNVNYSREKWGDVCGCGSSVMMRLKDNSDNDKVGEVILIEDEWGKSVVVSCREGKKEKSGGGDIGVMELWCGCGVGEGYVVCDGSEVSIGE